MGDLWDAWKRWLRGKVKSRVFKRLWSSAPKRPVWLGWWKDIDKWCGDVLDCCETPMVEALFGQQGWHQLMCCLFKRLGDMWCYICTSCTDISQCSSRRGVWSKLVAQMGWEGRWRAWMCTRYQCSHMILMGAGVMKSTIEHKRAVIGCFGGRQFGKRMMLGYYVSKLMYANVFWWEGSGKKYEEGLMSASVKEFQSHALFISRDMEHKDGEVTTVGRSSTFQLTLFYWWLSIFGYEGDFADSVRLH